MVQIQIGVIEGDEDGDDDHIFRGSNQDIIPRVGETIWLPSGNDLGFLKYDAKGIRKKYGTTSFIVVEVCHWIGCHGGECSVYLRVNPLVANRSD